MSDPNADLQTLHDRYYESLENYQDAVKDGNLTEINEARSAYIKTRSDWIKARGVNTGTR